MTFGLCRLCWCVRREAVAVRVNVSLDDVDDYLIWYDKYVSSVGGDSD